MVLRPIMVYKNAIIPAMAANIPPSDRIEMAALPVAAGVEEGSEVVWPELVVDTPPEIEGT